MAQSYPQRMPERIRIACVQMMSRADKAANLERADEETVVSAELDRARLRKIREQLPSLPNRRPDAYRWPAPA